MGEAKRREKVIQEWASTLTPEEMLVAGAALGLFNRFIKPRSYSGGCYHIAFLLTEYLRTEKGLVVTPVVGYVNDGTDEIMISHAWIEYNSKKTDVSLAVTDWQTSGSLIVLDREFQKGECSYSYHRTEPPASRIALEALYESDPRWRSEAARKDVEHQRMMEIAADNTLIWQYLQSAPEELNYEAITSLLD